MQSEKYFSEKEEFFSLKKHAQNEAGRLVSDLFLFFEKALCEIKASSQHLSFKLFLDLDEQ